MGGVKRYIEQLQAEEDMHEWITEHADLGVVEGDPEWEELKAEYLSGGGRNRIAWDDEYLDDEVLRLGAGTIAFSQFSMQMSILREELPAQPSDATIKMTYSYSVTLMETCLGDMIKSLILSDERYLMNAIDNVKELKKVSLSLREIYTIPDIVKKVVIKNFSDYHYHNVKKIVPVYSAVLGEKKPEDVKNNMPSIIELTEVRHDIVHRNGMDKEGNTRILTKEVLLTAMEDIHAFVKSLSISIDAENHNREEEL